MGNLQIDLLGTSFAIRANEESEYLEKLLGYYKRIVGEIEKNGLLKNPTEIAIMSGLMLVDELYKEKSKTAKRQQDANISADTEEAERITLSLIEKIDKALH